MKYIDKSGQGNTLLILTDAESRRMRELLRQVCEGAEMVSAQKAEVCLGIFNRGIQRGTERMAAEFKDEQRAKKASDR